MREKKLLFAAGLLLFGAALLLRLPGWLNIVLYLAAYIILGAEVIVKAAKNIVKRQVFNENFLMAIASIGAFAIGEYAEGTAVMLFYQLGEIFQDIALERSESSIEQLIDLRPEYANVLRNGSVQKVSPEEVNIGEEVIVKPGERIPLDGYITEGTSYIDTSALTGESNPEIAEPGKEVFSGTMNMDGLLTLRVSKSFKNSASVKILELIKDAASKKAPAEKFITRFARIYTPVVVLTAVLMALVPPLLIVISRDSSFIRERLLEFSGFNTGIQVSPDEIFPVWIYRALIFLVISCPCALVISVPLGYFGGIGLASRNGILVKGGNYLEALNNLDAVIFDKTGTLTKGVFEVSEVVPEANYSREELLRITAEAESYSNHPIAKSITKKAGEKKERERAESHSEIPGLGVKLTHSGKEILVGNRKLMEKENISFSPVEAAGTIVYTAVDRKYAGHLVVSDIIREDSRDTINKLTKMGIRTAMLTGDRKQAADETGKVLGVNEIYPELLPGEKVMIIEKIKKEAKKMKNVAFIGDGINDAPVIARSDVGMAMGGLGSDAAIEAADIVFMSDEPSKVLTAIDIAKKTRKVVWQNIIFAFSVKAVVLILGAGGMAAMWEAVFADVGVALIAILNAMRLINRK